MSDFGNNSGGLGNLFWRLKFPTLCDVTHDLVYCTGRGIPTGFGRVFHLGMGMGMDSCTRELQNKPWIIQNR